MKYQKYRYLFIISLCCVLSPSLMLFASDGGEQAVAPCSMGGAFSPRQAAGPPTHQITHQIYVTSADERTVEDRALPAQSGEDDASHEKSNLLDKLRKLIGQNHFSHAERSPVKPSSFSAAELEAFILVCEKKTVRDTIENCTDLFRGVLDAFERGRQDADFQNNFLPLQLAQLELMRFYHPQLFPA